MNRWQMGKWVKSRSSFANGNCVQCRWRKSSHSAGADGCVEVGGRVLVRDSQLRESPILAFSPAAWAEFTGRLRQA